MKKVIQLLSFVFFLLITNLIFGQDQTENWDTPKLMGKRYVSLLSYKGPQYLNTEWSNGTVYLSNGDSVVPVFLKYNRHLDELIYFNKQNNSMVRLDKKPVSGFTINDGIRICYFKKIAFGRTSDKAHYCEVLYSGRTEFLAQRRSELLICASYTGNSGVKKDMEFKPADVYFIYDKTKGILPMRLRTKSLYLKFGESKKKEIRKIVHQKHLSVTNENSMVQAWKFLEEKGFNPIF
jgi:DNA-dependent RNA polymerase auxiliary subunit epsilon